MSIQLLMSQKDDQWIRIFDVSETKLHNGYTIYKISSTVFQREFPAASTDIHVWRRYSAIKHLYKEIVKLHSQYKIPEKLPQFSKPLLINRFDKDVIENRRKETIELLKFCARYSILFASEAFTNFFKDKMCSSRKNKYFTEKQHNNERKVYSHDLGGEPLEELFNGVPGGTEEDSSTSSGTPHNQSCTSSPIKNLSTLDLDEHNIDETFSSKAKEFGTNLLTNSELHVESNDSYGKGATNSKDTNSELHVESNYSYRKGATNSKDTNSELHVESNYSYRRGATNSKNNINFDITQYDDHISVEVSNNYCHINPSFKYVENVLSDKSEESLLLASKLGENDLSLVKSVEKDLSLKSIEKIKSFNKSGDNFSFGFSGEISPTKLGGENVLSSKPGKKSTKSVEISPTKTREKSPTKSGENLISSKPREEHFSESVLKESCSHGSFISIHTDSSNIEIFSKEKKSPLKKHSPIKTSHSLGQIYAGEPESETSLIRRKTAEYLQRAESLMAKFSWKDFKIGQTKKSNKILSKSRENIVLHDPYLKNYKVIGISGKVIVANDIVTNETVAIKVIVKNEVADKEGLLPPCHVPYMVPLITYHEADTAVYLVLKYVRGGNLWDHLRKYMLPTRQTFYNNFENNLSLVYAGRRLITGDNNINSAGEINANNDDCDSLSGRKNMEDISDINEFSINLNLAISECKSTIENLRKPLLHISQNRFISSLSSLEHIIIPSSTIKEPSSSDIDNSSCLRSSIKSKSLTDLHSKKENNLDNIIEKGATKNFVEYDNVSDIGSDTLSGVSDDFSCSSFTPQDGAAVFTTSPPQDGASELTTSAPHTITLQEGAVGINTSSSNYLNLRKESKDINYLIKNSKKLLEDVSCTLERSKKHISRKVSFEDNETILNWGSSSNGYPQNKCHRSCSPQFCTITTDYNTEYAPLTFSALLEKYSSKLSKIKENFLPEGLVRVWMSQVVTAIQALHNQGFIWGDFNPSNILLDDGGSIIVTYYNDWASNRSKIHFSPASWGYFETKSNNFEENWEQCCGYVAPELFSPLTTPTVASDWWSVGALMFHLLTGQNVATAHPCGITSHSQINISAHISSEASSLISNLLCAHPSERLGCSAAGFQEIKMHPFFFGIEWPS